MSLKKVKFLSKCFIGVFAILMLVMALTHNAIWGYIAIADVAIYGIFHVIFWRCPKCKKNLGVLYVKHCPNCGEKIS